MSSKKDKRDQLAEASQKSESLSLRHPTGGGSTLIERPLKRSVLEEPRHNAQAPAEKKSKNEDLTNTVKGITLATTSGGNESRQGTRIRGSNRLTSCSATQQLPQPESSHAHACTNTLPSDKSEPASDTLDVHARAANYWRDVAMLMARPPLWVGSPRYSRPPDPTDNELYIFVTALRSWLSLPEQSINRHGIMVMGDYLMQRDVLARLKRREDYVAIRRDAKLVSKLVGLEQVVLQTVLGFLHKGLEEGKITLQDIGRWRLGNPPQQ